MLRKINGYTEVQRANLFKLYFISTSHWKLLHKYKPPQYILLKLNNENTYITMYFIYMQTKNQIN